MGPIPPQRPLSVRESRRREWRAPSLGDGRPVLHDDHLGDLESNSNGRAMALCARERCSNGRALCGGNVWFRNRGRRPCERGIFKIMIEREIV